MRMKINGHRWELYCDGNLLCWTENPQDAMKIQVAMAKLDCLRGNPPQLLIQLAA